MRRYIDDYSGKPMIEHEGKVITLPETEYVLKQSDKAIAEGKEPTKYRIGTTLVTYPNGTSVNASVRFYAKSIVKHPDTFAVGKTVGLAIQAEGKYAGRAVAQLPGATIDVNMFAMADADNLEPVVEGEEIAVEA